MKNFFVIKRTTVEGVKEKKIYEIDRSETRNYLSLGGAIGINMDHCVELGAKHKEDFSARVSAYRIVKDPNAEKISAEVKKVTGKDIPYISVCFYEKLDKSLQFMFVPRRLEIEGRPELNNFPFNVVFMSICKADDNCLTEQTAVYLPDFTTYGETDTVQRMKYFNSLDQTRKFWLEILYSKKENSYIGYKYCGEKSVGGASGKDWDSFFSYLTQLGVSQDADFSGN